MSRTHVSPETAERIFAALVREADLDDLIIASASEIAEHVGLSQQAVSFGVRELIADGRLIEDGRAGLGGIRRLPHRRQRLTELPSPLVADSAAACGEARRDTTTS